MIIGRVVCRPGVETDKLFSKISGLPASDGMAFNYLKCDGFEGGYFLSPRLPYTAEDFFYSDFEHDILVLMSGSVYNSRELIAGAGLERDMPYPGLVARLFLDAGPDFVKELNGDFAICIHRPSGGETFLFRDHAGIRPLVFARSGGSLSFSTDQGILAAALDDPGRPETDFLLGLFRYADYRKAAYSSVRKLLPGHCLRFAGEKVSISRYWDPWKIRVDRRMTHEQMLDEVRNLVNDAVRIRCDKRFTAGAHVSGGIDSGIVSTLARKEYDSQDCFYGFSWSPGDFSTPDPQRDERPLVRSFCSKKEITPVFSDLNLNSFLEQVAVSDENKLYFVEGRVQEQAAERGVNLIFSGWGGDDFVSTGDYGIELDLLAGLRLKEFFKRNPVRPFRKFAKYFLSYIVYPFLGILPLSLRRYFREQTRYILKPWRKNDRRAVRYFYFYRSRRQHHLRLLEMYHIQERCESCAVSGYRKGIEYRYPLLDRRIIELILRVPSELLCRTDYFRPLLREAGEGILPDEVRLNWSKEDHAYWSWMESLYKQAASALVPQVSSWKSNKDLFFIDFGRLERDIALLQSSGPDAVGKGLFSSVVFTAAMNYMTTAMRERQESKSAVL